MGIISKPYTFTSGTTIDPAQVNANFDTLFTEINGLLDAANIEDAAITRPKCASGVTFEAGVKAVFAQASAPAGWTQVTTDNDKMLRVVSGTGGGTGGSWGPTTGAGTAHYHTGGSHYHNVDIGYSAANIFQMKAADGNSFSGDKYLAEHPLSAGGGASTGIRTDSVSAGNTGSESAHTHTISSSWRPAYKDVIVCSRD